MSIINKILKLLHEQGKTQADICNYIGIKPNVFTTWKTRGTDPPAKFLIQICEFLSVSLEYLLTDDDSEQIKINDLSNRSINFSSDTDFSGGTFYNVTGDDADFSSLDNNNSMKKYEKYSGIIEHIESLPEREQWKAIFKLEDVLKEEFSADVSKKNH